MRRPRKSPTPRLRHFWRATLGVGSCSVTRAKAERFQGARAGARPRSRPLRQRLTCAQPHAQPLKSRQLLSRWRLYSRIRGVYRTSEGRGRSADSVPRGQRRDLSLDGEHRVYGRPRAAFAVTHLSSRRDRAGRRATLFGSVKLRLRRRTGMSERRSPASAGRAWPPRATAATARSIESPPRPPGEPTPGRRREVRTELTRRGKDARVPRASPVPSPRLRR